MKKFKILIEGKNLLIRIEEEINRVGFFATRFVQSENRDAAEKAALNLIKNELRDILLNERSDPPKMNIDEVFEVESFEETTSDTGFTWYVEDKRK